MMEDIQTAIDLAIKHFTKIKHYRGLLHAYKLKGDLEIKIKLKREQLKKLGGAFLSKLENLNIDPKTLINKNEFQKKYQLVLSNPKLRSKAISMERTKGDEFALMTEIVTVANVKILFKDEEVKAAAANAMDIMRRRQSEALKGLNINFGAHQALTKDWMKTH